MEKLKVCFVGAGSIARRHIENLKKVCNERNIEVHIDGLRHSKASEQIEGIEKDYYSFNDLSPDYDIIFITNPTELHLEYLNKLKNKGKSFFVEKPFVSFGQINDAETFKLEKNQVLYVACPLRYSSVIQYLKNNIDFNDVFSIRAISSSYLPDWRPNKDYRETYSAHKSLGGGVSLDLIHEWDYLSYLCGMPQKIYSLIDKKSNLEIDSDDIAVYIANYPKYLVELHLDYFGRKTIREIQLMTSKDTIIGDLVNSRITFLKEGKVIDFEEDRNVYQINEIRTFLDVINGRINNPNDLKHAIDVLKLTQGISI